MADGEGSDSLALDKDDFGEGNDSSESFSASKAGGDIAESGSLDSEGDEDENV